jgi:hypothetical protein
VEIPLAILAAVFAGYVVLTLRWNREQERRITSLERVVGQLMVIADHRKRQGAA